MGLTKTRTNSCRSNEIRRGGNFIMLCRCGRCSYLSMVVLQQGRTSAGSYFSRSVPQQARISAASYLSRSVPQQVRTSAGPYLGRVVPQQGLRYIRFVSLQYEREETGGAAGGLPPQRGGVAGRGDSAAQLSAGRQVSELAALRGSVLPQLSRVGAVRYAS